MEADDLVGALLADLDDAIHVLRAAGEEHWQSWLQRGRERVAGGDVYGLDHLLGAFGGMGSFNDLVLSQPNTALPREELAQADDRLWDLRERIWSKCTELKRDLGR